MRTIKLWIFFFCLFLNLVIYDSLAEDSVVSGKQKELFDRAADYSKKYSGRAVLIQQRGEILYERYDGWGKDTPHMLASGTKSFTGVLAMFAVQDGLLNLDERVCETITEWEQDPQKNKITIRHLLTLASGLDPGDAAFPTRNAGALFQNPVLTQRQNRIARQDESKGLSKIATGNWFQDSLKVPMKQTAGNRFDYGPSHFYVFGALMNRKLQSQTVIPAKTFEEYALLRIFKPLDIQIGRWGKDKSGNVNIPGGMMLTAKNWAKFGQFVLDKGSVKSDPNAPSGSPEKNLLKEELLMQCFEASSTNKRYGLTWWLNGVDGDADGGVDDSKAESNAPLRDRLYQEAINREADVDVRENGVAIKMYMAAGLGKQRLFIIPQYDLVVVRFAEPSAQGARFQNDDFLKPIVQALATTKP